MTSFLGDENPSLIKHQKSSFMIEKEEFMRFGDDCNCNGHGGKYIYIYVPRRRDWHEYFSALMMTMIFNLIIIYNMPTSCRCANRSKQVRTLKAIMTSHICNLQSVSARQTQQHADNLLAQSMDQESFERIYPPPYTFEHFVSVLSRKDILI